MHHWQHCRHILTRNIPHCYNHNQSEPDFLFFFLPEWVGVQIKDWSCSRFRSIYLPSKADHRFLRTSIPPLSCRGQPSSCPLRWTISGSSWRGLSVGSESAHSQRSRWWRTGPPWADCCGGICTSSLCPRLCGSPGSLPGEYPVNAIKLTGDKSPNSTPWSGAPKSYLWTRVKFHTHCKDWKLQSKLSIF